jgi:hypothetical protein
MENNVNMWQDTYWEKVLFNGRVDFLVTKSIKIV